MSCICTLSTSWVSTRYLVVRAIRSGDSATHFCRAIGTTAQKLHANGHPNEVCWAAVRRPR